MEKTALERAIEWRMIKIATWVPKVEDIEEQMGAYMSPEQAASVQKGLNTEAEKSFALRHPFISGVPTLGIWPSAAHHNLQSKTVRDLLRTNPKFQKALQEKKKLDLERYKADAPSRAVNAAALPAMIIAGSLAQRNNQRSNI